MRNFLNWFACLILGMCCFEMHAQNFPVYNSYYLNPFLYNPAEALTEYSTVHALHRQQWRGVEGAPVMSTLTFTSLFNDSRAGLGGKVSSFKRGILNTTDFSLTYAYGIPIGGKNWLFLGLSAGAISNQIDMNKVTDPNDPVLATYSANNMQPVGGFGVLYRSGTGFNVGISLPQLFPPSFTAASFSNTTVSPTDNVYLTLYYKRKVESRIATKSKGGMKKKVKTEETIAPLEMYFNYKYSKYGNSQFELLAKLNLSQYFWVGGSYKLPYGFTANTGVNIGRFTLGYSYEPGSQPTDAFSTGTHEVIMGLRLGHLKRFKRPAPVLRSTLVKDPSEKHTARFQETTNDPNKISQTETETIKKYFVVIKIYNDFTAADQYKRKLITDKFNADIFYNPQDKKYYVHVLETLKSNEAYEEVKNLKALTKLKDARVMIVTTNK